MVSVKVYLATWWMLWHCDIQSDDITRSYVTLFPVSSLFFPRMFYVASREGQLPEVLSMVHVRRHTPVAAVIILVSRSCTSSESLPVPRFNRIGWATVRFHCKLLGKFEFAVQCHVNEKPNVKLKTPVQALRSERTVASWQLRATVKTRVQVVRELWNDRWCSGTFRLNKLHCG